uniref:Uncharacterized protein n=1 Tax=mine drainage metagenome TaxID=410659 RepID=E6Q4I3_9ZZZZ
MAENDDVTTEAQTQSSGSQMPQQKSPTVEMMDSIISLGSEKLIGVAASVLIVIGYFAPLVMAQGLFSAGNSVSYSLSQAGLSGAVTLALGIALALLPFEKTRINIKHRETVAYGVSCALFGTLAILWLASLSLPVIIASMGGLSIGFYSLMCGFALNVFATAKALNNRIVINRS